MNVLPRLIENYNTNDIFYADETALFFKCLPKMRITALVESNMKRLEKLKFLVIGKT